MRPSSGFSLSRINVCCVRHHQGRKIGVKRRFGQHPEDQLRRLFVFGSSPWGEDCRFLDRPSAKRETVETQAADGANTSCRSGIYLHAHENSRCEIIICRLWIEGYGRQHKPMVVDLLDIYEACVSRVSHCFLGVADAMVNTPPLFV